jgi:hypothetical protein
MSRRTVLTVAAIPFALALALGASSQRLVDRWWPTFPHDRIAASPDGSVTLRDTLKDAKGEHPRVITMRLASARTVTSYQEAPGEDVVPFTLPDGQVMWRFVVRFDVDPDMVVGACTVQVRDARGREFRPGVGYAVPDVLDTPGCTPPGAPGPMAALSKDSVDPPPDPPRPASYERWYAVIMPAGVRPHDLRIWFDTPLYAEFPVTATG